MTKLSALIDDFADGVINPTLWTSGPGISETGGRLVITPSPSFPIFGSAVSTYDLTSSQVTAHIPAITVTGSTGTLDSGMVVDSATNVIAIRKVGSQLICSKRVGGVHTDLAFTPYSAVNHLYWRIRESGGNIYWETSATGTGGFFIQNTTTVASLFPVTSVGCYFYSGYSGFEPAPGTLQLEAVNPGLAITAAGASTASGSAVLLIRYAITGAASSTSSGSVAITIPPLTSHAMTGAGVSTSTGTAQFIILVPGQITASGGSVSSGAVQLSISHRITATGSSFSDGSLTFTIYVAPTVITQYFYFEPPVAYDLPPTLPNPRPRYINAHARWKGGQRRGRSVLKLDGNYITIDTPTVDQTLAATEVYMGGHIYLITDVIADALVAAGYTVIPIPVSFTLYPGEDVFPENDLYPGYQELLPA